MRPTLFMAKDGMGHDICNVTRTDVCSVVVKIRIISKLTVTLMVKYNIPYSRGKVGLSMTCHYLILLKPEVIFMMRMVISQMYYKSVTFCVAQKIQWLQCRRHQSEKKLHYVK